MKKLTILTIVALLSIIIVVNAQTPKFSASKAPAIKPSPQDITAIKDAFNTLVMAQKELENAVLKAQLNNDISKDYFFNFNTFQFELKKEEPKPGVETKKP